MNEGGGPAKSSQVCARAGTAQTTIATASASTAAPRIGPPPFLGAARAVSNQELNRNSNTRSRSWSRCVAKGAPGSASRRFRVCPGPRAGVAIAANGLPRLDIRDILNQSAASGIHKPRRPQSASRSELGRQHSKSHSLGGRTLGADLSFILCGGTSGGFKLPADHQVYSLSLLRPLQDHSAHNCEFYTKTSF